jgi:hypothetical protein
MIPWCHSVVTSWGHVGVGRVHVVLVVAFGVLLGASDSPPNYWRNNKRALVVASKASWVTKAGGWGVVTRPLVSALLEGWVDLAWFKPLKTLGNNGFLIPSYLSFMVSWFREIFTCYCRWVLVLGLVLVSWCYGVMTP